jgi:predicted HicB family RNase H-like nuclease
MGDRIFTYKGYCGSIEPSVDDDCLFGTILFINDLVTYEGEKPSELEAAFKQAVDFYLAKCEQEGLEADKPFSGTFNVRLTPELHKEACVAAAKKGQTLNEFVKECVVAGVSDKSTTVNITENHNHFHGVGGAEGDYDIEQNNYDEGAIETWQQHLSVRPLRRGQHQKRAHATKSPKPSSLN